MKLSRRAFLGASAAAALPRVSAEETEWFDQPMRWAQIAFVEDDPGNYDPRFWLDYLRRIHADGACLSAGGYIAFYPTEVPLHYRSRFLRPGMDPFGELLQGCRAMGMRVLARTDPHACHEDVHAAHPDWIAVGADGRKMRHWADPRLWVTCTLGPYNWEFMTAVTREIMQRYKPDGIFTNRWEGPPMCYCEHCRANFQSATGLDLPRSSDPTDRARREYLVWREKRFFDLWALWDEEIRKIHPPARFIPNIGGSHTLLDMAKVGERASILFADRQARRGLMPAWSNGRNGKEYRATLGRKPVGGIASVGVEEPYRWKDSVQSGPEIQLWLAEALANGMRPWFTKFNAKVIDRRWMKPVEEIYTWAWRNERYLRNEEPLARVAMLYSQHNVKYYSGAEDHTLGFYHALIESRIPFEMAHEGLLDAAHLDRFKVLVLPNIATLSEAQCRQLESYVERGGSLVATFETSLYDEWGAQRREFGLAKLFGCAFAGEVQRRMQNSYLALEPGGHPLLAGLEEAPRIINGVKRVATKPLDPAYRAPLTLIPSYPDLPMEEVYPRAESKTTQPEVYLREHGKGRVVYFPFDIDRTFWEVLSTDHLLLLRNAVRWAMREEAPVEVRGPGVLDVTVWRQKDSITVHLVNLTNPMMMKGPVREVFPVGAQKVSLALPPGRRVRGARLLTLGRDIPFAERGGRVLVEAPSVTLHEVVAFELA